MPFLQKKGYPNFEIDHTFPWIQEAIVSLNQLFTDNSPDPIVLLENFKKYEYIMNIDKKEMVDSLFKKGENKDEKALLTEIKEQANHFENAYIEILTLAEDEVNFNIFRVITKKLKNDLAEQAQKCKERILEATYHYCKETVSKCSKQFNELI